MIYVLYHGGVPIDSPVPDMPSYIAVIETKNYTMADLVIMDEWAGACNRVFPLSAGNN